MTVSEKRDFFQPYCNEKLCRGCAIKKQCEILSPEDAPYVQSDETVEKLYNELMKGETTMKEITITIEEDTALLTAKIKLDLIRGYSGKEYDFADFVNAVTGRKEEE